MTNPYLVTFVFDEVYDTFSGPEEEEPALLTGDAAYEEWMNEFKCVANRWENLKSFEIVSRTVEGDSQFVTIRLNLREEEGVRCTEETIRENLHYVGIVAGDIETMEPEGQA